MILESIEYEPFVEDVREIFNGTPYFCHIEQLVRDLIDANFKCYRANMRVLEHRREKTENWKAIADGEWVARSVGEVRVHSKAEVNKIISGMAGDAKSSESDKWHDDDIVYSIGEMLDRLSIEYIKQIGFRFTNEPEKIPGSVEWARRVRKYLQQKLADIASKGFYECVPEQRTYQRLMS